AVARRPLVDTKEHRLWLCEADLAVKAFKIAIGRGGAGKRKQGDLKTPLGTYSLGSPRASTRFGIFIPIGYPTTEQSKQGFTGKDVGIHGPDRRFRWLGGANNWMDWTQGCIAVATDDSIEEISNWVNLKKIRDIHVL
ncbi:MAG: murein L,D-transpeptidase family protein, partial [Myxococcaceae bacterium]